MVLEFWFEQKSVMPSALEIVAQGALFVSIAVGGVHLIGLQQAGMAFLFFVGLPSIPFFLKIFQTEVEKEERRERFLGSRTLARHYQALKIMLAFFLGLVLAFSFWYMVLPAESSNALFSIQMQELKNVQGTFQGAIQTLALSTVGIFETIFTHNLQVLLFVIIFSIVYGAGAIFIIIWNASVIGVFLGEFSKAYVLQGGGAALGVTGGHVTGAGIAFLGILPHGVFELLAYMTAALAGGILSAAIIRGDARKPIFAQLIYDIAKLLGWAIIFLAVGAFIETYPLS
ncbi:MAG: stage II sporulation protein M [Candidatus Micrarchaeota archaeon]